MRILKLVENSNQIFAVFNTLPELTYEKIGRDYVGSAYDDKGNIIESRFLKRESYGNAFAGRELTLSMKDGSIENIKNYWFDYGPYSKHGEFINIGAETVESLQHCYVYTSYNINKKVFTEMKKEYLTRDKIYTYKEVEIWCNEQIV